MIQELSMATLNTGSLGDSEGSASRNLASLIRCCNDVDEFRSLLQNHGIWLNHKAAESAFCALRTAAGREGAAISDEALETVVGGVEGFTERGFFLDELIRYL